MKGRAGIWNEHSVRPAALKGCEGFGIHRQFCAAATVKTLLLEMLLFTLK